MRCSSRGQLQRLDDKRTRVGVYFKKCWNLEMNVGFEIVVDVNKYISWKI